MAEKYTIQTVIPTGKSDPMYGTEFHVKFAENEGTFKLWYKTPPTEGQVQEGDIDGWKFKKAKKEWDGNSSGGASSASASAPTKPAYQPRVYKDNSDGMRQGMCFNNAATYVLAVAPVLDKEPLNPTDWARAVKAYAQALYLLGDLAAEEETVVPPAEQVTEVTVAEAPKSVQDIFGVTPPAK